MSKHDSRMRKSERLAPPRAQRENVMRSTRRGLLVSSLCVVLIGCSDIFEVDNPGALTKDDLATPEVVSALKFVAPAAVADMYTIHIMHLNGMASDDLRQPSTQINLVDVNAGYFNTVTNTYLAADYNRASRSLWRIKDAIARLQELLPNPEADPAVGRARFWEAIMLVTLADTYEQVTWATGPDLSEPGPAHTPVETYEIALSILGPAAQQLNGLGDTEYAAAAYATMARIERTLFFEVGGADHLAVAADYAEQALAADSDFRVELFYQPPGSVSFIWSRQHDGVLGNTGVGLPFANRIDPVSGQKDPRTDGTYFVGFGVYGEWYHQVKYPSASSPVPVSRWQEPVLIIAEHRLETGDFAAAVANINVVRAAAGLPNFESDSPDEIREQLIYERMTEFWLEMRNWQDHRNYGIFPVEWIPTMKDAGLDRRMPISVLECQTNPSVQCAYL